MKGTAAPGRSITLATVAPGPRTHRLGYRLACAWGYHRLEQTLEDFEYLTFAPQPMVPEASAIEASSTSA